MESRYFLQTLSDGRKVVVGFMKFGPLFENQAKHKTQPNSQKHHKK